MRVPPEFAGRADDYVAAGAPTDAAGGRRGRASPMRWTPSATRIGLRRRTDRLRVRRRARGSACPRSCMPTNLPISGGAALAARLRRALGRPPGTRQCRRARRHGARRHRRRAAARRLLLPARDGAARHRRACAQPACRWRVATDFNPGSSPCAVAAADAEHGLHAVPPDVAEALRGVTAHAAAALGLADRGRLAPGLRCDLALYRIARPAELCYWIGGNPCIGRVVEGH